MAFLKGKNLCLYLGGTTIYGMATSYGMALMCPLTGVYKRNVFVYLVSPYGCVPNERFSCTWFEYLSNSWVAFSQSFSLFWFVDRLMENVRVRRAGFAFRQEYDVALQRYEGFSFFLPSRWFILCVKLMVSSTNLAYIKIISPSWCFSLFSLPDCLSRLWYFKEKLRVHRVNIAVV